MRIKKQLILAFLTILVAVSLGGLGYIFFDKKNADQEVSNLQEEVRLSLENANVEVKSDVVADKNEKINVQKVVDIERLQKANPDILAWINIPGTVIDYPIAQHPTDDSYYLKHGPEGLYSAYGCPYIELCDSGSFMEFNTVVYGHNMNDGSMFASLHKYEDEEYFKNNREIDICTADHVLSYEIYAAVMYSDAHIPYYYSDDIKSDRTAFLKSLKDDAIMDRSVFAEDVDVSEDDYIITLSTCDKKLRDNRFLVVAVLKSIDGQGV